MYSVVQSKEGEEIFSAPKSQLKIKKYGKVMADKIISAPATFPVHFLCTRRVCSGRWPQKCDSSRCKRCCIKLTGGTASRGMIRKWWHSPTNPDIQTAVSAVFIQFLSDNVTKCDPKLLQCSCSGWSTGYGNKLSNSQTCCLAQLCPAAA